MRPVIHSLTLLFNLLLCGHGVRKLRKGLGLVKRYFSSFLTHKPHFVCALAVTFFNVCTFALYLNLVLIDFCMYLWDFAQSDD